LHDALPIWENAFRIIDKVNDISLYSLIGRAFDAHRFMKGQINWSYFFLRNEFCVYTNFVVRTYFGTHFRDFSVNRYPVLLDELVCLSSRTKSGFSNIFVDSL